MRPQGTGDLLHLLVHVGVVDPHALVQRDLGILPHVTVERLPRYVPQLHLKWQVEQLLERPEHGVPEIQGDPVESSLEAAELLEGQPHLGPEASPLGALWVRFVAAQLVEVDQRELVPLGDGIHTRELVYTRVF